MTQWTRTAPTVAGYYWYIGAFHRDPGNPKRSIVDVAMKDGALVVKGWAIEKYQGLWWPVPVEPPPLPKEPA